MPACNADGVFDVNEVGPAITETGEVVLETADNIDAKLDGNPTLDNTVPGVRQGTGFMRLGAEILFILGAALTWKRKQEAEALLAEVDANPQTPKVADQAMTEKTKKTARKLAG